MKSLNLLSAFVSLLLLLLIAPAGSAQGSTELSKSVGLKSHGGATFKAPDWKAQRSDDSVAVLERSGKNSRGGFMTLVLAVEEGPVKVEVIDWAAVRANILGAAKGAGSDLDLEQSGDWSGAEGFKGHRFTGSMRRGERDVAVHMVALMSSGVMVTVTALGSKGAEGLDTLAAAVAATTKRPSVAP